MTDFLVFLSFFPRFNILACDTSFDVGLLTQFFLFLTKYFSIGYSICKQYFAFCGMNTEKYKILQSDTSVSITCTFHSFWQGKCHHWVEKRGNLDYFSTKCVPLWARKGHHRTWCHSREWDSSRVWFNWSSSCLNCWNADSFAQSSH